MGGSQKKLGYESAGLWKRLTFSYVAPLIRLGWRGEVQEDTAEKFHPSRYDADVLAGNFDAAYNAVKVHT